MESLSDLIEAAEGNPGCIRIGNNGYGASDHIMAAVIAKEAGIDVSHVPFPGTSDMIDALEKGYIDVTAAKISEVASQAERGDLRILCIFSDERFPEFPDVPTAKELGVDIEFGSARALAAPKDTPKHIIGYLSDAFRLAIEDPETVEAAHGSSIPLFYMSPDELSLLIDGMMVNNARLFMRSATCPGLSPTSLTCKMTYNGLWMAKRLYTDRLMPLPGLNQ